MLKSKPHQSSLRKGRFSSPGQIYHITFTSYQRTPLSFSSRVSVAQFLCSKDFNHYADTLAWVIMPDHVHLLLKLSHRHSLSRVVQRLKSRSARTINDSSRRSGPIWQSGFYDHALKKDEDVKRIARYIVQNPVRAGLVHRVGDYPFWNAIWI